MGMEKKGEGRVNIPLLNEGTKMAAMPRRRQGSRSAGTGQGAGGACRSLRQQAATRKRLEGRR